MAVSWLYRVVKYGGRVVLGSTVVGDKLTIKVSQFMLRRKVRCKSGLERRHS